MFFVETLSARISTDRTPSDGAPTVTRNDQGLLPSSPRLSATPPPSGRRRLRLIFSKFHLLPRCSSSTIRLPFFQTDLLEVLSVEPGRARAAEPVESRQQSALCSALVGNRRDGSLPR